MIVTQEVQPVKGFSAAFNNLVVRLLEKDPSKRMTWPELVKHEFWSGINI